MFVQKEGNTAYVGVIKHCYALMCCMYNATLWVSTCITCVGGCRRVCGEGCKIRNKCLTFSFSVFNALTFTKLGPVKSTVHVQVQVPVSRVPPFSQVRTLQEEAN